ncbi:hypothetical protein BV129_00541 [Haemophilus influenzae]|uniref:DUF2681 domain-containing protein n=1 Tax=Haemophilus influenzae TaxID=727 RepID=UPI000D44A228|nr:DUF2681 domain-containing protein [Haemophilus influenzae]PRL12577.1 hypothetical protein BV129_00541 [Haemophilus influenzae]
MGLDLMLSVAVCGVLVVLYVAYKLKRASREIDRLLKSNEQLAREKAVVDTQVKHFEVRKKNEENTRNTSRDDVINRLQQSGDLRD